MGPGLGLPHHANSFAHSPSTNTREENTGSVPSPAESQFTFVNSARDRVRKEAAGVLAIADQLDEGFRTRNQVVIGLSGKVFVTGSGTSGIIARRMAHLLTVCGTPSLYIQPMDALHQ